jgi:hypothetical protein
MKPKYLIQICQNQNTLPCDCPHGTCQRGFFSIFLSVLYGIAFAQQKGWAYEIDLNDKIYAYSQPEIFEGEVNFWNYFFENKEAQQTSLPAYFSQYREVYPHKIWLKVFFREMNEIFQHHITFKPEVQGFLNQKKQLFEHQKVLGVHIRGTDHSQEVKPIPLEVYQKAIEKEIKNYHKLFVCTDEEKILEKMISTFGADTVIFNEFTRSATGDALHTSVFSQRYQLGLEALTDCMCLSWCKKAILCNSNLSYTALIFNPQLSYTLLHADFFHGWQSFAYPLQQKLLSYRLYILKKC